MESRIAEIEKSVSLLSEELKSLGEAISNGFKKTNSNFESVTKQLISLHDEIKVVNAKINQLKGDTNDGFGDVGMKLETLTEEITKISKVTGYDETFNNLKGFN